MARRFDFVSVSEPTKPGFGLTSADRQKVRSRAAKNDPFAINLTKRRPKKEKLKKGLDEQLTASYPLLHPSIPRSETLPLDGSIASDIALLAFNLSLSSPTSPEVDNSLQKSRCHGGDEGYFSVGVSPQDESEARAEDMELDSNVQAVDESNHIALECNEQLIPLRSFVLRSLGEGCVDPFWTFPIEFRRNIPAVINHEVHFLAPFVPDLDFGEERTLMRWFSLGVHEPAHLYASLAFAAAHLLDAGGTMISYEDVFFLKGHAISAVNEALRDPNRATTSPIIGAVMCLAAFEFAFGDTSSYSAHMEGSKQMLAMRGGMGSIEPWIARLLKWVGGSSGVWDVFWPYSRQMDFTGVSKSYSCAKTTSSTFVEPSCIEITS